MFTPVSMAEAVISTNAKGFHEYKSLLDELPSIYAEQDEQKRDLELLRWSVRCTLNSTTRLQGLSSLAWITPRNAEIRDWLLPGEAEALLQVICSEDSPNHVLGIIELMTNYPSQALDNYLMDCLPKCHEESWHDTARYSLQHLASRLDVRLSERVNAQLRDYWNKEFPYVRSDHEISETEKALLNSSLDTKFGWICAEVWRECRDKMSERTEALKRLKRTFE